MWQVRYYRRNGLVRVFQTCSSIEDAMGIAHLLLSLTIARQHVVIVKMK
jgi:hypothetical protein